MKKIINKKLTQASRFIEALIYNEATAMETFMFGVITLVVCFALVFIFKPSILHIH